MPNIFNLSKVDRKSLFNIYIIQLQCRIKYFDIIKSFTTIYYNKLYNKKGRYFYAVHPREAAWIFSTNTNMLYNLFPWSFLSIIYYYCVYEVIMYTSVNAKRHHLGNIQNPTRAKYVCYMPIIMWLYGHVPYTGFVLSIRYIPI